MSDMILYDFLEIVLAVMGAAYAYMSIPAIIGFFTTRHFPQAKKKHRYGIVIAARNEENVIGGLLESIQCQTYPAEYMTVFAVADNCTDRTAEVARTYGAACYERFNTEKRTKGFALQYLFGKIDRDYGIDAFDAYIVFDADNILKPDYMERMNDAFDSGEKIITSYRNTKNWENSCIAASYALHWMRTVRLENRAKSLLGMACRVQGTGFLFANELVKNGWNYVTLTEDRSFCTDAVIQNYKISYCDEAMFYDEQPYKLKVVLRQRLRWSKGHLQSTWENCPKLLRNMFRKDKNFTITYDSFFLNFPRVVERGVRKIISQTLEMVIAIIAGSALGWWKGIAIAWAVGKLKTIGTNFLLQLAVFIVYGKRVEKENIFKRVFHMIMFPMFDIIGKWTTYVALFKKVEWKPIPHDTVVDVKTLKKG